LEGRAIEEEFGAGFVEAVVIADGIGELRLSVIE